MSWLIPVVFHCVSSRGAPLPNEPELLLQVPKPSPPTLASASSLGENRDWDQRGGSNRGALTGSWSSTALCSPRRRERPAENLPSSPSMTEHEQGSDTGWGRSCWFAELSWLREHHSQGVCWPLLKMGVFCSERRFLPDSPEHLKASEPALAVGRAHSAKERRE